MTIAKGVSWSEFSLQLWFDDDAPSVNCARALEIQNAAQYCFIRFEPLGNSLFAIYDEGRHV